MEIEFAQNMKRNWYCTRISFQSGDIQTGLKSMRKAIKAVNGFLSDIDSTTSSGSNSLVRGLK
jgi:hypothetical protein